MGQGAVTWSSKKQHIIVLSSTEAEYIVQTHTVKEALWIRTFIGEFRRGFSSDPIPINCDNQGAIALAKDNKFHARTKHIDIRYHFIREAVEDHKIELKYIPTDDNVADTFTKALAKGKFRLFAGLLGLHEAWGGVLKYIQFSLSPERDIGLSTGYSGFRSLYFPYEFIDASHLRIEAETWVNILYCIYS